MSMPIRIAIALHPVAWREKHAEAVLGTLMDVADDRGGRVPAGETLTLGLRGLWLRARGSWTFWGGLLIVTIMVARALTSNFFELDASLTSRFMSLNESIGNVLVVLGLLGSWAGARARLDRIDGVGARLHRFVADVWPMLAFTAVGYVAALVILWVRIGDAWLVWPALLVVLAHALFALAAIAIGEMFGAVLPRVLAIFAGPAAIVIGGLLLFTARTPLVGETGKYYQGVAYEFDAQPFVLLIVSAIALIVLGASTLAVRAMWLRTVPVVALVGLMVAVTVQPYAGAARPEAAMVERPHSELVCSSDEPVICLWPEQEAAFGDTLRAEMADAYATALQLGLPVESAGPRSVAKYAMTNIPNQTDAYTANELGLGMSGLRSDSLLPFYATAIPSNFFDESFTGEREDLALMYAVSKLLGLGPDRAWPTAVDPYSGDRLFDPSVVPDDASARQLVDRWLAAGVDGVKSPN
ncbi:MAG: hypothetical protein ACOH1T_01160 [Microbacteriaceae bacterium]